MKINPTWILWGVGAGAVLLVLNSLLNGRVLSTAASSLAQAPFDAFLGAVEGATGIPNPKTADNQNKCRAAHEAGDDLAASIYCPALSWWGGLFDGK